MIKDKHVKAYMKCAFTFAECSSAKRLKVCCLIVKDDRIISIGYNGTPVGWDNCCETLAITGESVTKKEVLHAEMNAISKLAKSHESSLGAAAFITHAPCIECAKLLWQSGIDTIYYSEIYRSLDGIKFLNKCGATVINVTI